MSIVFKPAVIGILVSCFLMQLSHGPFYAFFAIYLSENSYNTNLIGFIWSLGVIAEILIFMKDIFVDTKIWSAKFICN